MGVGIGVLVEAIVGVGNGVGVGGRVGKGGVGTATGFRYSLKSSPTVMSSPRTQIPRTMMTTVFIPVPPFLMYLPQPICWELAVAY